MQCSLATVVAARALRLMAVVIASCGLSAGGSLFTRNQLHEALAGVLRRTICHEAILCSYYC